MHAAVRVRGVGEGGLWARVPRAAPRGVVRGGGCTVVSGLNGSTWGVVDKVMLGKGIALQRIAKPLPPPNCTFKSFKSEDTVCASVCVCGCASVLLHL